MYVKAYSLMIYFADPKSPNLNLSPLINMFSDLNFLFNIL